MDAQKIKVKKQEHSTYGMAKKLGEKLTPQRSTSGLEGKLQSSETHRAAVNLKHSLISWPFVFTYLTEKPQQPTNS